MECCTGIVDWLFGERVEIELPGGGTRSVTKRWLQQMHRQGHVQAQGAALGGLLFEVAVSELSLMRQTHLRDLDDETATIAFAELLSFLMSFMDRLALGSLGEPNRSIYMNAAIDTSTQLFSSQASGGAAEERAEILDTLISQRIQDYSICRDMGSHLFFAACLLTESFSGAAPSRHGEIALEIGKHLSLCTTGLLVVPGVRNLLRQTG